MTDEKKKTLLSVIDGMDVSEVISLLIMSGNSYSRRLLKFCEITVNWLNDDDTPFKGEKAWKVLGNI